MGRISQKAEIAKLQNGKFLKKAERDGMLEKKRIEEEQLRNEERLEELLETIDESTLVDASADYQKTIHHVLKWKKGAGSYMRASYLGDHRTTKWRHQMPPAKKKWAKFLVPLAGNQTQSVEHLQHSEEQSTDRSNNVQSEMFVVEDTEDMEEISQDVTMTYEAEESEEKHEEDLDQMKKKRSTNLKSFISIVIKTRSNHPEQHFVFQNTIAFVMPP
jgi:hypothetical protein